MSPLPRRARSLTLLLLPIAAATAVGSIGGEEARRWAPASLLSTKATVEPDLTLYRLRDQVFRQSPGGRRATELFYDHLADMAAASLANPEIYVLAGDWLRTWRQPIADLVSGRDASLTQEQVDALLAYVAALEAAGSPELADALARERERMDVESWAGLSMSELMGRINRLSCASADTVLCLNGGRFRVEASWRTPEGETGSAMADELTPDTGTFWFFDDANIELVVKVLDGCGVNGRLWVFAGGLTNVEVELVVTDTDTGEEKRYASALGAPFQPLQDTLAFATCGKAAAAGASRLAPLPRRGNAADVADAANAANGADGGGCVADDTTLCLGGDRFRVTTRWTPPGGEEQLGRAVALTTDTGYFWFFEDSNVETLVKVLDGCGVNGRYWVFGAGLTDLRVETLVTDTQTGASWSSTSPQGTPFAPIQDASAFATCF